MVWRHKGYEIQIDDNGTFGCELLGLSKKPSLKSIKAAVDSLVREKIEGTKAYEYSTWKHEAKEVTILNISYDNWFVVNTREGHKRKERTLYKFNEHNRKKIIEIEEAKKAVDTEEKKLKLLKNKLDNLEGELQDLGISDIKKTDLILENGKSSD